jgi:hypothetical protein
MRLAARGAGPAAFAEGCIPPAGVAARSNTDGILTRRALSAGRIPRLGAARDLHHGLLATTPERSCECASVRVPAVPISLPRNNGMAMLAPHRRVNSATKGVAMWIWLAGAIVLTVLLLVLLRVWSGDPDLGAVSDGWLARYKADRRSSDV